MSASPEHWCRVPQLENLTELMTLEERKALSLPYIAKPDGKLKYSKCTMYDVNYTADHRVVARTAAPPERDGRVGVSAEGSFATATGR